MNESYPQTGSSSIEQVTRMLALPDRIDQLGEEMSGQMRELVGMASRLCDEQPANQRRLDQLHEELRQSKEELRRQGCALDTLARKNQLLEEASRNQEQLTSGFQARRYLKPLGRDLRPLIQALEEGNLVTMERGPRELALRHVRTSLIAILERQGFKEISCKPGDMFEPRSMRLVRLHQSDSRIEDGTVQECCRPGLELDGEVVVLQEVIVSKYEDAGDDSRRHASEEISQNPRSS